MLTDRQLFLLQILIDDYISSAEPVGSRAISKRTDVRYSSATIRNELLDLEEMGFLEKPHSSSGRIPSEKGYRFYVDHLLSPELLSQDEIKNIEGLFAERLVELEKMAKQSAKILSDFTNYTSIVLGPEVFDTKLKHIQLIPLTRETAVAIIVTNTGHVENRTITMPAGIDGADIEKFVNILNERLSGVPLLELRGAITREITKIVRENVRTHQEMMMMFESTFFADPSDKVFYGGKTNMLAQPEFNDVEKVRSLLNAIEEEDIVYRLLRSNSAGIHIKIGHENDVQAIHHCSVITASYSLADEDVGTIAIIGPTRMQYRRVITLLDHVSNRLSQALTERYQNK